MAQEPSTTNISPLSYDLNKYFAYSFPSDLWQDPTRHGGNFVTFFINVRYSDRDNPAKDALSTKFRRGRIFQDANGVRLTDTPRLNQNLFEKSGNSTGRLSGAMTKRTSTAICLYMPESLNMSHKMSYKEEELGFLGTLATGTMSAADFVADVGKVIATTVASSGVLSSLAGSMGAGARGQAAASSLGDLISKANVSGNLSAAAGMVTNPHNEVLFQGVNFRKFAFKFAMYPKSQQESDYVEKIVNLFRFHMHPEIASLSAGRYFLFPSDFDIAFWTWDNENQTLQRENPHLFAASTCVLESMDVNYTPAGQFITHEQGWPLGIEITLNFTETEIMTKDRLMELEFSANRFDSLPSDFQV